MWTRHLSFYIVFIAINVQLQDSSKWEMTCDMNYMRHDLGVWPANHLVVTPAVCNFLDIKLKTLHRLANRKQRNPPGPAEGRWGVVGVFRVRLIWTSWFNVFRSQRRSSFVRHALSTFTSCWAYGLPCPHNQNTNPLIRVYPTCSWINTGFSFTLLPRHLAIFITTPRAPNLKHRAR